MTDSNKSLIRVILDKGETIAKARKEGLCLCCYEAEEVLLRTPRVRKARDLEQLGCC